MDVPNDYQALKAVHESYKAKLSEMDYEAKMATLVSHSQALDQISYVHRRYADKLRQITHLARQYLNSDTTENPRIILHDTVVEVLRQLPQNNNQSRTL